MRINERRLYKTYVIMEDLELKMYEVLIKNISVEEFENWLYNSEFLDKTLKEDSLIFNLVNINYRKNNALQLIKNIADEVFDKEEFLIMKIEYNCRKIVDCQAPKNIISYVLNIIDDFDFDIDSSIYFEFYSLYHSFYGYEFLMYSKKPLDEINLRTYNYAKMTLKNLENCKNIKEKKEVIFFKKEENHIEKKTKKVSLTNKKQTLKQKIFAFFKKS